MPSYLSNITMIVLFSCLPLVVFSGFLLVPINVLLAIPVIVFFFKRKKLIDLDSNFLRVFGVFLAWVLITSFWSINPEASLKTWVKIAALSASAVFLFEVLSDLQKGSRFKEKIRTYLPVAFVIGVLFFVSEVITEFAVRLFLREILTPERENVYREGDYNKAACFITLFAWPALVASLFKYKGKFKYVASIVIWVLAAYAISQASSSSAVLAFALSTLTFLFIIITKARFNILIHACVIFVMVLVPVVISKIDADTVGEDYGSLPNSFLHRVFIWKFSSDAAAEKPFIGWGMKSSRYIPGGQERITLDGKFYQRELLPSHPHSSVLQVLLECGIIGMILFLSFIYLSLKEVNKNSCILSNAAIHSFIISYLIIGLLAFGMWRNWWVSAGIVSLAFLLLVMNHQRRSS